MTSHTMTAKSATTSSVVVFSRSLNVSRQFSPPDSAIVEYLLMSNDADTSSYSNVREPENNLSVNEGIFLSSLLWTSSERHSPLTKFTPNGFAKTPPTLESPSINNLLFDDSRYLLKYTLNPDVFTFPCWNASVAISKSTDSHCVVFLFFK